MHRTAVYAPLPYEKAMKMLVLLNGRMVQRAQMQRGYATDQDKAVVTLAKGWNRLLCKVDDYGGGHGLCVRFMKADGSPMKDYKVCFVRPAPGAEARFVGYTTPDDAIQSFLWAIHSHDLTNLLQAFTPDVAEDMRKRIQQSNRTVEDYLHETGVVPGMAIWSRIQDPDGSLVLNVEVGPNVPRQMITGARSNSLAISPSNWSARRSAPGSRRGARSCYRRPRWNR